MDIDWAPPEKGHGVSPEQHMDKAEQNLKMAALAACESRFYDARTYTGIAEAHIKAAQILKDW